MWYPVLIPRERKTQSSRVSTGMETPRELQRTGNPLLQQLGLWVWVSESPGVIHCKCVSSELLLGGEGPCTSGASWKEGCHYQKEWRF